MGLKFLRRRGRSVFDLFRRLRIRLMHNTHPFLDLGFDGGIERRALATAIALPGCKNGVEGLVAVEGNQVAIRGSSSAPGGVAQG
jgi:hypothetical protein